MLFKLNYIIQTYYIQHIIKPDCKKKFIIEKKIYIKLDYVLQ